MSGVTNFVGEDAYMIRIAYILLCNNNKNIDYCDFKAVFYRIIYHVIAQY